MPRVGTPGPCTGEVLPDWDNPNPEGFACRQPRNSFLGTLFSTESTPWTAVLVSSPQRSGAMNLPGRTTI